MDVVFLLLNVNRCQFNCSNRIGTQFCPEQKPCNQSKLYLSIIYDSLTRFSAPIK